MRKIAGLVIFGILLFGYWKYDSTKQDQGIVEEEIGSNSNIEQVDDVLGNNETLKIEALRKLELSPTEVVEEERIGSESRYQKSIVSYMSEGNKVFALLGLPKGEAPTLGWPVIIFNHGYIDPKIYRTNERYVAYFDRLVLAGYVVVKSDYRGHGLSQGEAVGGYGSDGYTRDVRQLLVNMKEYPGVNPERIGMWGHSMGGHITLRTMVSSPDVKAGVIWAGVVASYPDLLNNWRRSPRPLPSPSYPGRRWRTILQEEYGTPEDNPEFWNSISASSYLDQISGPVQLHHGTADTSVPVEFSEKLAVKIEEVDKLAELYVYPGDDHNLSQNFGTAMSRTIKFFDTYLK